MVSKSPYDDYDFMALHCHAVARRDNIRISLVVIFRTKALACEDSAVVYYSRTEYRCGLTADEVRRSPIIVSDCALWRGLIRLTVIKVTYIFTNICILLETTDVFHYNNWFTTAIIILYYYHNVKLVIWWTI